MTREEFEHVCVGDIVKQLVTGTYYLVVEKLSDSCMVLPTRLLDYSRERSAQWAISSLEP